MPEQKESTTRTAKTALATDEGLSVAVSEKGAVSLYGVGRFPLTLYAGTWQRIGKGCEDTTGPIAEILQFIDENASYLAPPPDARSNGAKPKTESFTISDNDLKEVSRISDEMMASEDLETRKKGAHLMSIKATAEISNGKVTFEQLALAKTAIANAKIAPK